MSQKYDYYHKPQLIKRIKGYFFKKKIILIRNKIFSIIRMLRFKRGEYFYFDNKRMKYFFHKYNQTYNNERAIEIPIVINWLKNNKNFFEIGDVLHNYINSDHKVLDKYSKNPGVIKTDFLLFSTKNKYNRIVSISTIEHIGKDDEDQNENSAFNALNKIKKHLTINGEAIVTIPLGYNPQLDKFIKNNSSLNKRFMIRFNQRLNFWKEVSEEEISWSYPGELVIIYLRNK